MSKFSSLGCAAPLVRQLWPPLRHWAWEPWVQVAPLPRRCATDTESASGVDGEKLVRGVSTSRSSR